MTWQPVSFVEPTPPSNTDDQGLFQSYRLIFGAGSAYAPLTWPKPTPSFPPHVAFRQAMHEGVLMARRQALISTVRKLRRDHRATSSAMDDLRAVTLAILAQGER